MLVQCTTCYGPGIDIGWIFVNLRSVGFTRHCDPAAPPGSNTIGSILQVKQKDLQSKAIAEQATALRRVAAVENQRLVQAQMDAKLRKDYLADIAMTSSEEQMNAPSLKQAVQIVKVPHIVRVQW